MPETTSGLKCLRCSDVTEPRLCDRIEYCSDGEVCAVQMFRADNGDTGYWTGCLPTQQCTKVNNRTVIEVNSKRSQVTAGEVVCKDCCSSDICNAYGCGSPEYPHVRGPICFDCQNVLHPADCHKIVPCNSGEKCSLQERILFGQRYYTSKCEKSTMCPSHLTGPVVGRKRQLSDLCAHCCDGDLCNLNCTSVVTSSSQPTTSTVPPTAPSPSPAPPSFVAFHVKSSHKATPGPMIFDHEITNIGNAYNNKTGVFTASVPGLYVFSWTIETYGEFTEAVLVANSVPQGSAKAQEAAGYYDTTTSFALLELQANDKVYVNITQGRPLAEHTMFSGWKINQSVPTPGFYASLTTQSGHDILFDHVHLNKGLGYSRLTGRFTAPYPGLYVFMTSVLTYGDSALTAEFKLSHQTRPNIYLDSSSGLYDGSGYMTFAWLKEHEYVYIRSEKVYPSSMFAGWMVMNSTNAVLSYPAFMAKLYSSSRRSPIVFDQVYPNYSHGYSTSTGVFTADRNGVYIFLVNIEAHKMTTVTAIKVNGQEKTETRSDGRHESYDDTCAVSVLQLNENDRVSVKLKSGTADEGQTIFFGFLLHES